MFHRNATPEVYTVREIARAADVAVDDVRAFVEARDGRPARYVRFDQAVTLARALRAERMAPVSPPPLFAGARGTDRPGPGPFAASGAIHAGILGVIVLVTGLGVKTASTAAPVRETAHLVFLATPGPGGGGGGGGLRLAQPAPKATVRGRSRLRSPVTVARGVAVDAPENRVETPPPPLPDQEPAPPPPETRTEPTPPLAAPVVSVPADEADTSGVLNDSAATAESHGSGEGGGTGTGRGTGSGDGNGAGIGPGSVAGIGGGPYRPGSGIAPPSLLHEVKPVYTEEGRRRSVEGDVVLEVVVRADGTVGTMRVVQGLGSGLNERAADAVRQWRFAPARRFGAPVDVLVEVAVEFRLR